MKNLFITESHIGEHHRVSPLFKSDVLSFTFAPNLYKIVVDNDFSTLLPDNIKPIRLNGKQLEIKELKAFALNYKKIFIGMDLDIEGNAMARMLLDYFIESGKSNLDIIRIPLTDKGFIAVSNFWKDSIMNEYLLNRRDEMEFIQLSKKVNGSSGVGRRTVLLINEILNPPECVENLNPEGTSSITYIYKKRIREK